MAFKRVGFCCYVQFSLSIWCFHLLLSVRRLSDADYSRLACSSGRQESLSTPSALWTRVMSVRSHFQVSPKVFYWIDIWRTRGPIQDGDVISPIYCKIDRAVWIGALSFVAYQNVPVCKHLVCKDGLVPYSVQSAFNLVQTSNPIERQTITLAAC